MPLIDAHVFEVVLHHSLQRKRPPLAEHGGVPHGGSRQHDRRGTSRLPEDLDVTVGLHQIQRAPTAGQVWMQTFSGKITAALELTDTVEGSTVSVNNFKTLFILQESLSLRMYLIC